MVIISKKICGFWQSDTTPLWLYQLLYPTANTPQEQHVALSQGWCPCSCSGRPRIQSVCMTRMLGSWPFLATKYWVNLSILGNLASSVDDFPIQTHPNVVIHSMAASPVKTSKKWQLLNRSKMSWWITYLHIWLKGDVTVCTQKDIIREKIVRDSL